MSPSLSSVTRRLARRIGASAPFGLGLIAALSTAAVAQSPAAGDAMVQTVPGTDVSFELRYMPGGAFQLGSPSTEMGRDEDEGPQRAVSVDPFWIGATEVTYDLFAVFRDADLDTPVGATPSTPFDVDGVSRPSPPYEDPAHGMSGPGKPATGMTRLSALRFARWISEKSGRLYRLPTEAEWEFACRAGTATPYGIPDAIDLDAPGAADAVMAEYAWFAPNSGDSFHEVAAKSPNAWGVHDLLGNVAEWTLDPYAADFYASLPDDGSAANPSTGPSSRGRGVVRGGAFDDDLRGLRCADRFEETPQWKRRDPQIPKSSWWNTDSPHVGLRLVSPARDYTIDEIRAYWVEMLGENDD